MDNEHGPGIAPAEGVEGQGNNGVTVISLAQGLGLEFVPLSALQFLDGADIARCGAANRFLHKAAVDEEVWRGVRDRLWEGKVFVPASSRAMRAKEGYLDSLRDSTRTWLEPEELTSFCWWFRFKQQAGEAWTAQDPWYHNKKVRAWVVGGWVGVIVGRAWVRAASERVPPFPFLAFPCGICFDSL